MRIVLTLLAFLLSANAVPAQPQPDPCPATHYQCSPGICCPR